MHLLSDRKINRRPSRRTSEDILDEKRPRRFSAQHNVFSNNADTNRERKQSTNNFVEQASIGGIDIIESDCNSSFIYQQLNGKIYNDARKVGAPSMSGF